jgi:NAD+ synthase
VPANDSVLAKLVTMDFDKTSRRIQDFIASYVRDASAEGIVIGLSGGLDSSVAVKLCVEALGKKKVLGLVLPSKETPLQDVNDAKALARELGIRSKTIDIEPIVDKFMQVLPNEKKTKGNLMARIRMSILYHHAYDEKRLVVGTSDKSEFLIGYYTKYGDGGADLLPIADLYKTQVRALGAFLGVPKTILQKKSSPALWKGHLAEKEIGMEYEVLDPILHLLVDKKMDAKEVAEKLGTNIAKVKKVQEMIKGSGHKRATAKIAYLSPPALP